MGGDSEGVGTMGTGEERRDRRKGEPGRTGGTGDPFPPPPPHLTMAAVGSGAVSQPDAEAVDVRGAAEHRVRRGAL